MLRAGRPPRRRGSRVHPDVIKLGVVSLLTDVSSEMIFSVFAVFFTTITGASAAFLGAHSHTAPQSHHGTALSAQVGSTALHHSRAAFGDGFSERRQAAVCSCNTVIFSRISFVGAGAVTAGSAAKAPVRLPSTRRLATIEEVRIRQDRVPMNDSFEKKGQVSNLLSWKGRFDTQFSR